MQRPRLNIGYGGWHRVDADDLDGLGHVYFRVQVVNGALRLTELYLDGRGVPLSPGAVRDLPLGVLETWAASDEDDAMARLAHPGPDLSRLAAHFATMFGKARHWVADSFRAQIEGSGVAQATMPRDDSRGASEPPPLTLDPPPDGRLTDAYLTDVARAYDAAVLRRLPPAVTLAAMVNVSPKTVHSWVAKARDRGIMPRASRTGRIA